MKIFIWILSLGLMLASVTEAGAAVHKKSAKKQTSASKAKVDAKKDSKGDLQTDIKFDGSVLRGQYQTPDEILAKVENEKGLKDLLGARKHFKDRLSVASEQE